MRYLLDTHTMIWLLEGNSRLSDRARQIINNRHIDVYVSTISLWEIALKQSIGKFGFSAETVFSLEDIEDILSDQYIGIIGLNEQESLSFYHLPQVEGHRDPFDRMLAWQAIKRSMTLLSSDVFFKEYEAFGLHVVW